MKSINDLSNILKMNINYLEIFVYFLATIILIVSVIKSMYYYVIVMINDEYNLSNAQINLLESISLALSFILIVEVLKMYYIKTYKQLIIVSVLVVIKIIIKFFIRFDLKNEEENNLKKLI